VPVERLESLARTGLWVVVILVKVNGENESRNSESIMRATWWNPEWVVEGLQQVPYVMVTVLQNFSSTNEKDKLFPPHAPKAYKGHGGIAPPILNIAIRRR
jgi:hypothetical protein